MTDTPDLDFNRKGWGFTGDPMPDTLRAILESQKKRHDPSHTYNSYGKRSCFCCSMAWPCPDYQAADRMLHILDEAIQQEPWFDGIGWQPQCRLVPDPETT